MMKWATYTHGSKNDSKVVCVVVMNSFARQLNKTTLSTDLCRNLPVQQNIDIMTLFTIHIIHNHWLNRLLTINCIYFLQCYDNVGWVTVWAFSSSKICHRNRNKENRLTLIRLQNGIMPEMVIKLVVVSGSKHKYVCHTQLGTEQKPND